jgi:hypothetical protein
MHPSSICSKRIVTVLLLCSLFLTGCMNSSPPKQPKKKNKKSPNSIIGKTTQEIEKFDPNANIEISDSKVKITNPITGALEAYGPILEKHFKGQTKHAIELYRAEHGVYPKDYEEFMEKVVIQGQIWLPVLPGKWKYSYDEKEHDIKVIRHLDGKGVKQAANEKNQANKKAEGEIKKNPAVNFLPGLRGVQGGK